MLQEHRAFPAASVKSHALKESAVPSLVESVARFFGLNSHNTMRIERQELQRLIQRFRTYKIGFGVKTMQCTRSR